MDGILYDLRSGFRILAKSPGPAAADRTRELAIKTALGAGRERLIGQVLGESLCLALVATPFGLALAYGIVELFNASIAGQDWPFWFHVAIDAKAVAFIVVLTAVSAVLAGLMPAIRSSRIDVQEVLKDEGRGGGLRIGKLARGLVVAEVALSCVLLIGAGLMVRSIVNLQDIDFAFETEGIMTARLGLQEETYPEEADRLRFFERLQAGLGALPGVESAALSVGVPGSGTPAYYYGVGEKSYASDDDYPWAFAGTVAPSFFETLDVAVKGRDFNAHDGAEGEAVAIVNRSFVEREWPGENPLGKRVRLGRSDSERPWMTVVGVVPDLHMAGIENRVRAGVYRPLAQSPPYYVAILAKTGGGDPMALTQSVRGIVRELDRGIALFAVETLAAKIDDEKFFYRMIASIFSGLGLAAVLLAAVGMYGVLAFSVSKRTTEIGIRVALGAGARDVRRLVVGQGMRQVVAGLVLGLVLAAGVASLMSSQLFGVQALDPLTFGGIAVVLLMVGVLAALVPAERARRVDPIVALRYE